MSELVYLAGPYSHPEAPVRVRRAREHTRAAVHLMRQGHAVFSPIAHGHALVTEDPEIATGWAHWARLDQAMVAAASTMVVLQLPGWETSEGVQAELQQAQALGKRVGFLATPSAQVVWQGWVCAAATVQPEARACLKSRFHAGNLPADHRCPACGAGLSPVPVLTSHS